MYIDYARVEFYLRFKKIKKKVQLFPSYILPYEFKHINNATITNYF